MITLKEGLELAIKAHACKGNIEAFKNALAEGDTLECYQIALGNRYWLRDKGVINTRSLKKLEKLSQGIGKLYHDNGQLYRLANYKNDKNNGLCEEWYANGQLNCRSNYKNDKLHGLYEYWNLYGQLMLRANYKNDKLHGL